MKSLAESMNEPLGKQFKDTLDKIFKWDWIFSTPFEKIVIISSIIWGAYSLGRFILGLF